MHGLHTTTWLFDIQGKQAIKVIDQYRDADDSLLGAFRVIKGACEDLGLSEYLLKTENNEIELMGSVVEGITVTSSSLNVGVFVPQVLLDAPVAPLFVKDGVAVQHGHFPDEFEQ